MSTQSDPGNQLLDDFIDLRDSVRHQRIGRGGHEVCAALTSSLDRAIEVMVAPVPANVTVVALGGYGRSELSPYSDVDLMLLHDVEDPSALAAELFRPLWDAKLRVGHSVRTLDEAGHAARARFDTHTTLLTSRLVAGDVALFDELMQAVTAVTRARPLRRHLVAEERDRREKTPFALMATDLKTGRGGMRTLQGFEWERRREGLIGRFTSEFQPEEEVALERLLQIRNGLHAVVGRPHDVFSPELREPVAKWLGVDTFECAGWLVESTRTVDGLATKRWPEIAEPIEPKGRRLWSRARSRPEPVRADHRPSIDEMVELLASGGPGQVTFDRLWEKGYLVDVLPEWEVVRFLPQLAPFHEHPVHAHLWRTVAEMLLLAQSDEYGDVFDELAMPDMALLAAFLHDIGKGHGGDHAEVGAGITEAFCARMEIPGEPSDLLVSAVRHHLLLAETATRRDLDDPAVIDEVAERLGGRAQLQLVYLLTVADSRATGPTMWSDWKATLLGTLYERCATRWAPMPASRPGTATETVVASLGNGRQQEGIAHLKLLPDDYLRSHTPSDVVWHLDVIAAMTGSSELEVRSGSPVDTALVVGRQTGEFRIRVAEVFAANGIDVLEARLHTRADGVIVDSFQVHDDRTGDTVTSERWERVRADLEAGLSGELDTESKVTARASAYQSHTSLTTEPRVECTVDSASGDVVVVVKCSDRIGRLAEILTALAGSGLEVRLAKLDSRGDQLVDTFHVRGGHEDNRQPAMEDLARQVEAGINP